MPEKDAELHKNVYFRIKNWKCKLSPYL